MARIIESFECVLWKNMIMKNNNERPIVDPLYQIHAPIEDEKEIKNSTEKRECNYCHKTEEKEKFKRCSRCKKVLYCSKECQKEDWKKHKIECEKIVELREKENHSIKIEEPKIEGNNRIFTFYLFILEEKFLDNYEKAIEKAKWVRENSKNMSDKERKEAAAKAALELMNLIGEDEEEEGEEQGKGEDSNDK